MTHYTLYCGFTRLRFGLVASSHSPVRREGFGVKIGNDKVTVNNVGDPYSYPLLH